MPNIRTSHVSLAKHMNESPHHMHLTTCNKHMNKSHVIPQRYQWVTSPHAPLVFQAYQTYQSVTSYTPNIRTSHFSHAKHMNESPHHMHLLYAKHMNKSHFTPQRYQWVTSPHTHKHINQSHLTRQTYEWVTFYTPNIWMSHLTTCTSYMPNISMNHILHAKDMTKSHFTPQRYVLFTCHTPNIWMNHLSHGLPQ